MRRPLYLLPDQLQPTGPGNGHRGLWYDKFCNQWGDNAWTMRASQDSSGVSPKLEWIRTAAGQVGLGPELREYARRLVDLIDTRGGEAVVVTAKSRFVTGLGRSHPVENGFAWHPTLGIPYLPGSSLKGVVRAWAKLEDRDTTEFLRLLGDGSHAGALSWVDAVPVRPIMLEADVLTPHYANWSETVLPGDWRSPTPVPFLVAAVGLSLLCGVVPLRGAKKGDAKIATEWLTSALDRVGAGAKTAVGYGHFQVDPTESTLATLREERRRREAMATPEGRWQTMLGGRSEEEILTAVREDLPALTDPVERRAFVSVVLNTGMVRAWKRGEKTDLRTPTGPKKLKDYARRVLDRAGEFGIGLPP